MQLMTLHHGTLPSLIEGYASAPTVLTLIALGEAITAGRPLQLPREWLPALLQIPASAADALAAFEDGCKAVSRTAARRTSLTEVRRVSALFNGVVVVDQMSAHGSATRALSWSDGQTAFSAATSSLRRSELIICSMLNNLASGGVYKDDVAMRLTLALRRLGVSDKVRYDRMLVDATAVHAAVGSLVKRMEGLLSKASAVVPPLGSESIAHAQVIIRAALCIALLQVAGYACARSETPTPIIRRKYAAAGYLRHRWNCWFADASRVVHAIAAIPDRPSHQFLIAPKAGICRSVAQTLTNGAEYMLHGILTGSALIPGVVTSAADVTALDPVRNMLFGEKMGALGKAISTDARAHTPVFASFASSVPTMWIGGSLPFYLGPHRTVMNTLGCVPVFWSAVGPRHIRSYWFAPRLAGTSMEREVSLAVPAADGSTSPAVYKAQISPVSWPSAIAPSATARVIGYVDEVADAVSDGIRAGFSAATGSLIEAIRDALNDVGDVLDFVMGGSDSGLVKKISGAVGDAGDVAATVTSISEALSISEQIHNARIGSADVDNDAATIFTWLSQPRLGSGSAIITWKKGIGRYLKSSKHLAKVLASYDDDVACDLFMRCYVCVDIQSKEDVL